MASLFSHNNISDLKTLFEGKGMTLNVKFSHPFTAFLDCCTLVTCNKLVSPFVEPVSSKSGWQSRGEVDEDRKVFENRCTTVHFTESYPDNKKFPIS